MDALGFEAYDTCESLCGSNLPPDFGRWCLEQSVALADTEPAVACELLAEALRALTDTERGQGLTLEAIVQVTGGHDVLGQLVEDYRRPRPLSAKAQESEARRGELRREQRAERRRHQQEWAEHLRGNLHQLESNTCSATHLGQLGRAYFGLCPALGRHASGPERLTKFIGDDQQLVGAVLNAFRSSLLRPELPDVDETVALRSESQHTWLAYPVLAGLDLLDSDDPDALDELEGDVKRKVLAIYYCVPHPIDQLKPRLWHVRWLSKFPDLVEDVAFRCAVGALRDGKEHLPALSELDGIDAFDELKQRLRLRLLKSFPPRALRTQLPVLDRLISEALVLPERPDLRDLVDAKLAISSLTVAQRTRWLTTAALLFEGEYVSRLVEHVQLHSSAVRHIAEFLHVDLRPRYSGRSSLTANLSSGTLTALIEMLGRVYPPLDPDGLITVEIDAADRIRDMIHQLAQLPDARAGEALRRMEHDPKLSEWHAVLRWRREEQSAIQRDAEYRQPSCP